MCAIIGEINEIATTIASAVEEQQAATGEIVRNASRRHKAPKKEVCSDIGGVNWAATETGSAATQILGASNDLYEQSDTLQGEVRKFLDKVRSA